MGAEPPWSSGRESRGDRLEIGPLWRFLSPVSFPLKETGSRRSAKSPRPVPVPAAAVTSPPLALRETASGPPPLKGRQDRLPFRGAGAKRLRGHPAAAGNPPGFCGFAARLCDSLSCPVASGGLLSLPAQKGRKPPAAAGTKDGNRTKAFRLRATPFLSAEKWGKDAPGDHSIKVPRTPPHGQGAPPHWIPGEGFTKDEGREFGRGYGLPHPLRGFAMTGGRWTGGRWTGDERR